MQHITEEQSSQTTPCATIRTPLHAVQQTSVTQKKNAVKLC